MVVALSFASFSRENGYDYVTVGNSTINSKTLRQRKRKLKV